MTVRDGSNRCPKHKVKDGSFADSRRGSRHKRGYGVEWDRLREQVRVDAAGLCQPCLAVGVVHEGHHCDHRVSKGEWKRVHGTLAGVDDRSNLQWINRDCHAAKTAIDRLRAAGADVPPWSPASPEAAAGPAQALGAPFSHGPAAREQGRGGEMFTAALARTDRLVEVFTPAKTTPPGVEPLGT